MHPAISLYQNTVTISMFYMLEKMSRTSTAFSLEIIFSSSRHRCCTSVVCSRSDGWRRCGTGWWWVSSGCSWCHAGCHSFPPSSPPPLWFSWLGPVARRRLPGTRYACCVSITALTSPPAVSHLKKLGASLSTRIKGLTLHYTAELFALGHFKYLRQITFGEADLSDGVALSQTHRHYAD